MYMFPFGSAYAEGDFSVFVCGVGRVFGGWGGQQDRHIYIDASRGTTRAFFFFFFWFGTEITIRILS